MPKQVRFHFLSAVYPAVVRSDCRKATFLDEAAPKRPKGCAVGHPALKRLPCGNDRKALTALAIKRETTVPRDCLGASFTWARAAP